MHVCCVYCAFIRRSLNLVFWSDSSRLRARQKDTLWMEFMCKNYQCLSVKSFAATRFCRHHCRCRRCCCCCLFIWVVVFLCFQHSFGFIGFNFRSLVIFHDFIFGQRNRKDMCALNALYCQQHIQMHFVKSIWYLSPHSPLCLSVSLAPFHFLTSLSLDLPTFVATCMHKMHLVCFNAMKGVECKRLYQLNLYIYMCNYVCDRINGIRTTEYAENFPHKMEADDGVDETRQNFCC